IDRRAFNARAANVNAQDLHEENSALKRLCFYALTISVVGLSHQFLPASVINVGLLNQFRHQRRPPRLVTRTQPLAVVAMKILIKWNIVPPMGVGLEVLVLTEHRPPPMFIISRKNAL